MVNWAAFSGVAAGVFTVSLWGSLPVLRTMAELPPMLVAAVAMACATGLTTLLAVFGTRSSAKRRSMDWRYALTGVGGLVGALYFYFLALEAGDPAKITLITYTWPLGFVLISDHLAGKGLQTTTLLGATVAFVGLAPLILADGQGVATPVSAYAAGLASGMCWIAFSLSLRQAGAMSARSYQSLFLYAGLVALILHVLFEAPPASTTFSDWMTAGLIGLGPYGLAFMAWGYALRCGPAPLLGVLAYLVPVIAATLLVLMGWNTASPELFLAVAAVVVGAVVSQWPRSRGLRH